MRSPITTGLGMLALFTGGFVVTQQPAPVTASNQRERVAPAAATPRTPTAPRAFSGPAPALAPGLGQNPQPNPFSFFGENYAGAGGQRWTYGPSTRGEAKINKRISEAMKNLKSDKPETREEANKALTTAVAELFDARTEGREKQIKELEDRLAKLRAQLNERKAKKDEICQLQVQTLVNQANGLGF